MIPSRKPPDAKRKAQIEAELRRDLALRRQGYRDQALRIFPHVCARCAREFSGKGLKELTVHHKDHNYKNNPPDGSNWELLCIYCHDHEHEKFRMAGHGGGDSEDSSAPLANPFESLSGLFAPPEESDRGSEQEFDEPRDDAGAGPATPAP
jgi:hypothetical protein